MKKLIWAAIITAAFFTNNSVAGQATPVGRQDYRIEKTPDIAPEDIIEAIVARHKGSVVLIDIWATWCKPCLGAMKAMKSYEPELEERGVVTIYVTNASSPEKNFHAMVKEIGGIHYYLTESQKNAMLTRYDFNGIPHYMIFNKSGELTYNAGFPGAETIMRQLEKVW